MLGASTAFAQEPGLPAGTVAPDFTGTSHDGIDFRFSELYKDKPVVLIFYRGGWCYYCNLQLQEIQKNIKSINDAGAELIAISVDTQDNAQKTVTDKKLDFKVVSNPQADILTLYNVIYHVPLELSLEYKEKYDIDLVKASGRQDRLIAIPATYIINREGVVIFAHANTDYKVRPKIQDILTAIDAINK